MLFVSTGLRYFSIIIVIIVGETYRFERLMTGELRGFIA
jgi:dephospho-CoA kinase